MLDLSRALGATQRELAEILGISRRTVQRLDKDLWSLGAGGLRRAAIAVFPKDPELAARLAAGASTTLEELGLVPGTPLPSAAPSTPVSPPVAEPSPALADGVVCVAADAMNLAPRAVRPALRAAFRRAHELGLSVEVVKAWLETELETPEAQSVAQPDARPDAQPVARPDAQDEARASGRPKP